MQIRTHKYAKLAYPLVAATATQPHEAKYRTLALKFPTMVMQSGLAQAVGFLKAKDEVEHKALLQHIAKILNFADGDALHVAILHSDITEYQLLTRKTLDGASWLKRYTQALLSNKVINNSTEQQ